MKSIKYILLSVVMLINFTSCDDWLKVYPENSQVTEKYWSSKEEVESTLYAGYFYLRSAVEEQLIPWGEERAGCVYSRSGSSLQKFELKSTDKIANWSTMYQIINVANSVLANAHLALANDETYTQSELNSHYCEAYFLRALTYFYIVRNWRDAPLITESYESDEKTYAIAKSSEAEILAQIKSDLETAIGMRAAKEKFETTWETKGRATVWALQALMTDVCLYCKDYEGAITHADAILQAESASTPRFIATPSRSAWFAMFNPGNSSESIFELQWNYEEDQLNNLPTIFGPTDGRKYQVSLNLIQLMNQEVTSVRSKYNGSEGTEWREYAVRTIFGGYYFGNDTQEDPAGAVAAYVWKYIGSRTRDPRTATYYDPNYIIYRVADVMLMKAEALLMREGGTNAADIEAAMALVNEVRTRANAEKATYTPQSSLSELMGIIMQERMFEFLGESKAWYDVLRLSRYGIVNGENFKDLAIQYVIQFNTQARESWIRSVLSDEDAWFMPIYENEITSNSLLVQNPYYL
ncbi:MAG: RagB/SusD family nutrient uptake outer membrane protein [Bacteroidaceae bacterium]|nr:RagB/SusD family nutrient uptake outer membrane protein [Bacteroidaceae bacterium]